MAYRLIAILMAAAVLTGCATSADVQMAQAHYDAQAAQDRPLLHIAAQPGETIELRGVRELTVHAPAGDVTPYRVQHHPVWGILGETLRVAAPIAAVGHYSVRLADTVGTHAGDVVTGSHNTDVDASDRSTHIDYDETWRNDGRIESPDDYTHPPTVVEQPEPVVVQPASE